MQLLTKSLLLVIFCVVCASASYTAQIAYIGSGCTGSSAGGAATLNACNLVSPGVWTMNQCGANNSVQVWNCSTSACNTTSTSCVLTETLPACAPASISYAYVCYASSTQLPAVPVGSFSISQFAEPSCDVLTVSVWTFSGNALGCIPTYPSSLMSTSATCESTYLTVSTYNNSISCGGTDIIKSNISLTCTNNGVGGSVQASCPVSTTTTAATSSTAAAVSTSTVGSSTTAASATSTTASVATSTSSTTHNATTTTSGSTGTGTGTGGSTTAAATTTTTSDASALAASALFVVIALVVAL